MSTEAKATKAKEDDMTTMIPEQDEITVGDEKIEIRQIRVKQLTELTKVVSPIMSVLKEVLKGSREKEDIKGALGVLLMTNPEEVLRVVSICVDRPVVWVEGLELDDFMKITLRVVEVNLDFFIQRLLPSVLGVLGRTVAKVQNAIPDFVPPPGLTPSKPSYPEDTDTPTSSSTPTGSL